MSLAGEQLQKHPEGNRVKENNPQIPGWLVASGTELRRKELRGVPRFLAMERMVVAFTENGKLGTGEK